MAIVSGLEADEQTRMPIPPAVYFFVVGYVLREVAEREVQRHTGVTREEWRASVAPYIERVLASGECPNLQRVVTDGGDLDSDAAFEFILGFLLDGIAALSGADGTQRRATARGADGREPSIRRFDWPFRRLLRELAWNRPVRSGVFYVYGQVG